MTPYHEEEATNGKLFNRDVASMLLRYVCRYKKHLAVSLVFVVVITAATLSVPYISKIVIDQLIVKQGTVVVPTGLRNGALIDPLVGKKVSRGIRLTDSSFFVPQSGLSILSKTELERLTRQGIIGSERYTLIEAPATTPAIEVKLRLLAAEGLVRHYPAGVYLITGPGLKRFTVDEILMLRVRDLHRIGRYVLLIMCIFSARFLASYGQIIALTRLSQNAMRDLRRDLFAHVLSLELSFFDTNPIGKLVNRVTNDIEALNEMFSSVLITFFQDALILSGIAVVMFSANVTLGLTVAVTFPFLIVMTVAFRLQARKAYRTIRTRLAALNAFLNENISGIRIVRIFVQEVKQIGKFAAINRSLFEANMKQVYVYGVFRPLIEMFRWCAIAAVLCLGARLIAGGRISYGLVVMFLTYIGTFFEPLGNLAEKFDTMQSATAAGEKILGLFTTPSAKEFPIASIVENRSSDGSVDEHASLLEGDVRFDDVWFAYNPGEWVLKGVSFSLPKNRTLAIVGETGSGKTTITGLLTRLYAPQKGIVSIDGNPIGKLPLHHLRRSIGMVMQDVFLFSRSIIENITLDASFDREAFDTACRLSHCDRFILSLPHGAGEPVMERGATFSAGERQLLALARALYFNPSILILDEATSNIDTETEQLIQDAIAHLIRGRTSLVIAHRLSTIRSADSIIVLDKGTIAEQGDHATLIAAKGIYYNLYSLQFEAA
ncbi:MAG: ABC transporter ATP-binding protein [Chitinispirillaceae bacterium]|nr:ABC transporter ATP-binding protein [Chitinispirillaceae bacterium]